MSFWDIPDASIIRDPSTRIVLGPMRQNLMTLAGKFGADNYLRAATIQDLVDYGVLGVDRGSLYASGGRSGSSGSSTAANAAADRAATSASNAASSASSASTSAASAATAAGNASDAADQALQYSTSAGTYATNASVSASSASTSATNAANSASSASTSATNAANSAADAEATLTLTETTSKTDSYVIVLADLNKVVTMNVSATGKTITVPTNGNEAFSIGSVVHLYNRSSDSVDVVGDTGVTVRNSGSLAQYQEARLRKRATNEWVLSIY